MKRKIADIIIITITLMIILTIVSFATTGIVATDSLNLRKEASTDSNIIEILNENEKLEILSEEGDWYKVKHNDNVGYVNKKYMRIEETENNVETPTQTENNETATNTSENEEPVKLAATISDNIVTVNKDTKIRLIPSVSGSVIGNATEGSQLEMIVKINHWIFVQDSEISGWIPYIESAVVNEKEPEQDASEQEEKQEEEKAENEENNEEEVAEYNLDEAVTKYVNASSVYLRSKPTTESDPVTSLLRNTDVKVVGEENGWSRVVYNDMKGYIRSDLLSDEKVVVETSRDGENISRIQYETEGTSGTGNEIVDFAYNYLGCPYVYGGSGPSSFDCSGFTAYVYNHFGYSLPHSAVTQMNYGVPVDMDNLQPGDLVFFLDYQTMDGVGHCGIYIGDGNFIHASSGTGYCVKTSTLLSGSYRTRYYTARRLV